MSRQPICNSIRAAILIGIASVSGCGSDGSSSASSVEPSSAYGSKDPPPRPQTKEECDACSGIWAIHGIVQSESCICLTSDAGEQCLDGRHCIGQCLVESEDKFHVTEKSDPPRGYYTGTCSTYDTTFGCHLVIPSDISDLLPLPEEEAARTLCID